MGINEVVTPFVTFQGTQIYSQLKEISESNRIMNFEKALNIQLTLITNEKILLW